MLQQTQKFCRTCNRPTLHTRNRYRVPHLSHLVFMLVLIVVAIIFPLAWLAVILWPFMWLLHCMANLFSLTPYRCQQCGGR